MLYTDKINKLSAAIKHRNFSNLMSVGLLLIVLLQQFYINTRSEMVILVPPKIERSFYVRRDSVSESYLEEMTHFFLSLLLDVSSSSIDKKHNMLLQYIDIELHDHYAKSWAKSDKKFKGQKVATNFIPQVLKINTDNLEVKATGTLVTYMGGQRIESKGKEYKITFNNKGGVLLIKSFEEVREDD